MLAGKLALHFKGCFLPSDVNSQWAELIFMLVTVPYIKSLQNSVLYKWFCEGPGAGL